MLTHPDFDPVAISFSIGSKTLAIHWYGLMYLCGFAFAYWITQREAKAGRSPLKPEMVDDAIFWGAIGLIVGARLGYVFFYGMDSFLANPLWAFKVWEGGMSFHGGFIGIVVAAIVYARYHKLALGALFDTIALAAPMGIFFGRIGNFIGQELWGRPADVPWAMVYPNDPLGLARHPSQIYQALGEGLLVFIIIFWYSRKPRPDWSTGALFVMSYGILRSVAEFFREPDAHIGFDLFGWLTRGQLLSFPMIIIGLVVFIWVYRKDNHQVVRQGK